MKERKKSKKKEKNRKNKEKIVYIDDGRTVVDMDVEGFRWHGQKKRKDVERPRFREKLAIIFGAYRAYFPFIVIACLSLILVFLLFKLWLGA